MKSVRVSPDRWNFETADGAPVTPLGGNMLNDQHSGQGKDIPDTTFIQPTHEME